MKFNKIILFFSISVVLGVILRFLQIKYTVTYSTGFFISALSSYGYFIVGLVLVMALLNAVFAFNYYKRPDNPPRQGIFLASASFLLAASILYELLTEKSITSSASVQIILLKIFGMLTVAFFVIYGLDKFFVTKLPDMAATIPVIYVIIRIICDFSAVSALALISDYIFLILGYCLVLLFFMNFLKLYNGIDEEYNFRKILATGLSAATICIPPSVAHIGVNIASKGAYTHISHSANFSMLAFGIFIVAFLYTHFFERNSEN